MTKEGSIGELKRLKAEMVMRDISLADVAEVIETTEQTARDKINGRSEFKRAEIEAIAIKFDLPVSYFFSDEVNRIGTER